MTSFWVLSAVFAALALLFVVFPAYKFKRVEPEYAALSKPEMDLANETRQRQNVAIFKERLSEIEAELNAGKISQAEFGELKEELELALLADVENSNEENSASRVSDAKHSLIGASSLAVVVVVCSYLLYFQWGSYDKVQQAENMRFSPAELQKAEAAAQQGDMNGLLKQLHDRLQGSPDNVEGWMLYSRTAMNLEYFDKAAEGFNTVIASVERNQGNAAPFYGLLAQAYYFAPGGVSAEGEMSQEVQAVLEKALALDPNESNAIGLYALHAFETQDYEGAIAYWQKMLAAVPDHPSRASIEAGIQRAHGLAGMTSDTAVGPEPTVVSQAAVTVTVSLDKALEGQVTPNDLVFIFARAESGPPMPLAASRHRVAELPVTIRLDDSKAMAPMAKLSNVEVANIVARVSKSGQPVAQPGDMEGRIDAVPVGEQKKVSIVIDTLL